MYFYVLMSTDLLKDKSREEGNPNLELDEDILFPYDKLMYCKAVIVQNNEYRGEVHDPRLEVYKKYKEDITKREFSMAVKDKKVENIVRNFGKGNIIK